MKRYLIMAALAAAMAGWTTPGLCQKIGYVNSDSIFARFRGAQDVKQEMARAQAVWNQEVDARKRQIDSLQKALDDQFLVISSERRRTRHQQRNRVITPAPG